MSWESVEDWPGEGQPQGAPFRGTTEPVVATREDLSFATRARLYWASTPEFPYRDSVKRILMTPGFLYVETVCGERRRVRHEALIGQRREGAFQTFGVHAGQDLRLMHRADCAVERALQERAGQTPDTPWSVAEKGAVKPIVVFALLVLFTCFVYGRAPLPEVIADLRQGTFFRDTAAEAFLWMASTLWSLLYLCWIPSRLTVDALGITRTLGLFGWLRFFLPREEVSQIALTESRDRTRPRSETFVYGGSQVWIRLRAPQRLGRLRRVRQVRARHFVHRRGNHPETTQRRATFLGHRLASMLGVPIREGTGAPQSATPALDEEPLPQDPSQMRAWRGFVFCTSLAGALFFSKVLWIVNANVRMGTFGTGTRIGLFALLLLLGWAFGQRLCQRIGGSFAEQRSRLTLRVNILMASRVELECLPMIGPWRSNAIAQHREGTPFRSVDDVMQVSGIGEGIFKRIRPHLTLVEDTEIPSAEGQMQYLQWLFRFSLIAAPCVMWCGSSSPLSVSPWPFALMTAFILAMAWTVLLAIRLESARHMERAKMHYFRSAVVAYVLALAPLNLVSWFVRF